MRQGGEREKTSRMEGMNQRGKCIARNTPRVNGPTGPGEGRRQPRKEWADTVARVGWDDKRKGK
jgi:hypothetical protein